MVKPVIQSHLSAVLERYKIKPYGLWKAISSYYGTEAISRPTVYALTNGNGVPDSRTLNQVITALRSLTGADIQVGDLFEWQPDAPTVKPKADVPEREA